MTEGCFLLDTCAFIWSVSKPEILTTSARETIGKPGVQIAVSAVSCAEIACGVEKKRIIISEHWKPWFRRQVELNGWTVIPIDLEVLEEAYSLPGEVHADPADRILIATSRLHHMPIITADRKIIDYPHVRTIWE